MDIQVFIEKFAEAIEVEDTKKIVREYGISRFG